MDLGEAVALVAARARNPGDAYGELRKAIDRGEVKARAGHVTGIPYRPGDGLAGLDKPSERDNWPIPTWAWRTGLEIDWRGGGARSAAAGTPLVLADIHLRRADVERLWPPAPAQGGRPPAADREAVKLVVEAEIKRRGGFPERDGEKGWRTKADLVRFVHGVLADRGESAGDSTVGRYVTTILEELRAAQN
jgi:hypothetical protein